MTRGVEGGAAHLVIEVLLKLGARQLDAVGECRWSVLQQLEHGRRALQRRALIVTGQQRHHILRVCQSVL